MKYEVVISDKANADLRNIYEYIAYEKLAPEIASGFIDRLEEQILTLEELPYRFGEYDGEPWRSAGLRVMPIENYVVCFIPNDENATVTIVRVFYCGQNIENHL